MTLLWNRTVRGLVHRPDYLPGETDMSWCERIRIWQENVCLDELGCGFYMAVGPDLLELVSWARENLEVNEDGEVVIEVGELGPDDLYLLMELVDHGESFVLRASYPAWEADEANGIVLIVRSRTEKHAVNMPEVAPLDGTA